MEYNELQQQFNDEKVKEISEQIGREERLVGARIDVSFKDDGIVVLSGTIVSQDQHAFATQAAEKIPGIFHVENNLTLWKDHVGL